MDVESFRNSSVGLPLKSVWQWQRFDRLAADLRSAADATVYHSSPFVFDQSIFVFPDGHSGNDPVFSQMKALRNGPAAAIICKAAQQ